MSEVPRALAGALAERYAIEREIGAGGMALVYLACDRRHQREVALKVLRGDLAATLGAQRFLREIEIAARLSHPHILPLYDSGEAGGFLYYVMPFMEGGSLRRSLAGGGRMGTERALAVAAPVADALGYAHRAGVLHRDIKPENILFSQGQPVVADFGIAKAVVSAGGEGLTRTGFPLGTPGYMSPEQAAAVAALDARSDVFALAVVVYEMLVGEIPAGWPSDDAVRVGRFLEAPAVHRERLAEAGPSIEAALARALAVRRERRTPTPTALVAELAGRSAPVRVYSEEEVREIVRRASELEAAEPTGGGAMTLGGVRDLAAEVGIPSALVRRAAADLEPRPLPAPAARAAPRVPVRAPGRGLFEVERAAKGEVPDARLGALVDEIEAVFGSPGLTSHMGTELRWFPGEGPGERQVTVVVKVEEGTTRIRVQEDLSSLAPGIWAAILGGLGGCGAAVLLAVVRAGTLNETALIALPAWLGTMAVAARVVSRTSRREREEQLRELADRLAAAAGRLAPPSAR